MMTTGEAMRAARKDAGLSQRKLAEAAGVRKNAICQYENDQHAPSLFAVIALADALGLTVDEYIGHRVKRRTAW